MYGFYHLKNLEQQQSRQADEEQLKIRVNKKKKTVGECKLAYSQVNQVNKLVYEFQTFQSLCKSILFRKISMPCIEKVHLAWFEFNNSELIDKYKLQWFVNMQNGQVITKNKNNIIAYCNRIVLIKTLQTIEQLVINDNDKYLQEQKMLMKYPSKRNNLQFQYLTNPVEKTVRMIVKEQKFIYHDMLRQQIYVIQNYMNWKIYDISDQNNQFNRQSMKEFYDSNKFGMIEIIDIDGFEHQVNSNGTNNSKLKLKDKENGQDFTLELVSVENTINEKELYMSCDRLDDEYDCENKLWYRIYNRDNWFGNIQQQQHDNSLYFDHLQYLNNQPFTDQLQQKYQNVKKDLLIEDDQLFLLSTFMIKKNRQQNLWLEVPQLNDMAPKYRQILMERGLERNGYVDFISNNHIEISTQEWKFQRFDFNIICTEPQINDENTKRQYINQNIMDTSYYDYNLIRIINRDPIQKLQIDKNIFNPYMLGMQSQLHFIPEIYL